MSKLDVNALGWAIRETYNDSLLKGVEEYTSKIQEALAEGKLSNVTTYSSLLKDTAEQIKTVSELDSYGFLVELYKTMHTVWEEHLEYLREEQLEKMQKKVPS